MLAPLRSIMHIGVLRHPACLLALVTEPSTQSSRHEARYEDFCRTTRFCSLCFCSLNNFSLDDGGRWSKRETSGCEQVPVPWRELHCGDSSYRCFVRCGKTVWRVNPKSSLRKEDRLPGLSPSFFPFVVFLREDGC